jgi:beta-phosphoglucomutase-like phosphatase (HAD superfamily)
MELAIKKYLAKHGFRQFCPKAVLFDMDGVIYDSMPNHARSWHQAMSSVGIQMEESEAYLMRVWEGLGPLN